MKSTLSIELNTFATAPATVQSLNHLKQTLNNTIRRKTGLRAALSGQTKVLNFNAGQISKFVNNATATITVVAKRIAEIENILNIANTHATPTPSVKATVPTRPPHVFITPGFSSGSAFSLLPGRQIEKSGANAAPSVSGGISKQTMFVAIALLVLVVVVK